MVKKGCNENENENLVIIEEGSFLAIQCAAVGLSRLI